MNPYIQSLAVLIVIVVGSVYTAQMGWLGPYGMPNDIYHLLILIFTAFFTYLVFWFTVLKRGEPDD